MEKQKKKKKKNLKNSNKYLCTITHSLFRTYGLYRPLSSLELQIEKKKTGKYTLTRLDSDSIQFNIESIVESNVLATN